MNRHPSRLPRFSRAQFNGINSSTRFRCQLFTRRVSKSERYACELIPEAASASRSPPVGRSRGRSRRSPRRGCRRRSAATNRLDGLGEDRWPIQQVLPKRNPAAERERARDTCCKSRLSPGLSEAPVRSYQENCRASRLADAISRREMHRHLHRALPHMQRPWIACKVGRLAHAGKVSRCNRT
jgi:hypothetical protein